MTDKLKSELDAIFSAHAATKAKAAHQKSEREQREEAFLDSFSTIQESIIRPTFQTIGEYVTNKGYEHKIETTLERTESDGKYQPAKISIRFLVGDSDRRYRDHEYPHFSVICEKASQTFRLHESTMVPGRSGRSGSVGEFTAPQLTPELLNSKIIKLLQEVFR